MSTKPKYIFLRINSDKMAEIVNSCDSVKDANYWLNYIAEPGDAMFITSEHPKHTGSSSPEYSSHLISRRNLGRTEEEWRAMVGLDSRSIGEIVVSQEPSI